MKILYIDTSTNYLYTGIISDDVLFETKLKLAHELSNYTLYEIDKLFQKANIKPNEINKIIVVSGPGSFTGIRIGMTIAKIYAWSLKIEITSISSLDAMSSSLETNKLIVPLIDARRGFVYAGIYNKDQIILENQYIKLDNLLKYLDTLNQPYCFITNDNLDLPKEKFNYNPDILKIINRYKDKDSISPHLVEPNYLKLTEAEENLQGIKHDN